MESIRRDEWAGSLNIEVLADSELVLSGVAEERCRIVFRIPRDTYLAIYLPYILDKLGEVLKNNVKDPYKGWWFEANRTPLHWNHPVGVIYDYMMKLNPTLRSSNMTDNSINIWKLTLHYENTVPQGLIPILNGVKQIQEFWMHQWKQACFILNGSSKQMMSLSKDDSVKFWNSVLARDQKVFESIIDKIIQNPNDVKNVPLRIHQPFSEVDLIESVFNAGDYNSNLTLDDALSKALPKLFLGEDESKNLAKPVVQGIEIPLDVSLAMLYKYLMSFDGFFTCFYLLSRRMNSFE